MDQKHAVLLTWPMTHTHQRWALFFYSAHFKYIYIYFAFPQEKKTPRQIHTLKRTNKKAQRQRLGREVEFLKPWLGEAWEEGCGWQCRSGKPERSFATKIRRWEVDGRKIKSLCQQNLRGWHGKIWRKRRKLQQTTHPFSESKRPKNTYSTLTLIIICIIASVYAYMTLNLYIYINTNIYIYRSQIYTCTFQRMLLKLIF